jgi:hypothetical protein
MVIYEAATTLDPHITFNNLGNPVIRGGTTSCPSTGASRVHTALSIAGMSVNTNLLHIQAAKYGVEIGCLAASDNGSGVSPAGVIGPINGDAQTDYAVHVCSTNANSGVILSAVCQGGCAVHTLLDDQRGSFTQDGTVLDYVYGKSTDFMGVQPPLTIQSLGSFSGNFSIDSAGNAKGATLAMTNKLLWNTAPTISAGFGTGAAVSQNNGPGAFRVNVGTSPGNNGTVGLPSTLGGWTCTCQDITTVDTSRFYCKQTSSAASSAVLTNFNTAGTATAWVANDNLEVSCLSH